MHLLPRARHAAVSMSSQQALAHSTGERPHPDMTTSASAPASISSFPCLTAGCQRFVKTLDSGVRAVGQWQCIGRR